MFFSRSDENRRFRILSIIIVVSFRILSFVAVSLRQRVRDDWRYHVVSIDSTVCKVHCVLYLRYQHCSLLVHTRMRAHTHTYVRYLES